MYVWVVLTTFLAMIAAYFLPIREDTQKIINVPVAQAKMMQMVVKQKAGIQFMKENAYPFFSNETEKKVNYTSGEIDVAPYLPHGFVSNEDYVTAIYCMDEALTQIKTGEDACRKVEGEKIMRLLITYGAIPERWQSISVEEGGYHVRPSADLMEALRGHFGAKEMVGYVINESGKLYIVNYENTRFEVPQPVADNIGMGHYGIKDCLNDYKTCMAYMSWR